MEVLKEIAYTLTRYQVRQVDVITNPDSKPSKKDCRYWEAYVGLREQRWPDEEAFAGHFGMEYPSKNYNRFKNELKDRLWNTLLFTEGIGSDYKEYVAINHDLLQKWAVAEVLKQRAAFKAFRELANECLATAQKYELIKMVVDITLSMKASYFINPAMKKDYERVKAIYSENWPIYQAEVNIRNCYEEFVSELVAAKGYKKNHAPVAEKLVLEFQEAAARVSTIQFQFHYRLLHFYAKALCHDWHSAQQVADDAYAFFESKKFNIPVHLIVFSQQKASCLIMMGQYDAVKKELDHTLKLAAVDSVHHFKNRELATVNAFYAGNYGDAWEMCKTALLHERFDKIPPIDQESWRIYYGYLHFLAQTGRLQVSDSEKGDLPKFRLSSWLNDLPLSSLDKRGAQIPILILQTLLLLSEGRWDELENRIEALRKFRQRNLDPNEEHFRTNCFIQMLELLPKYAHDLRALPQAAAPLYKKLSLASFDILDRTFEIEVVPYERQWAWALETAGLNVTQMVAA
jgi:hypothetical protein